MKINYFVLLLCSFVCLNLEAQGIGINDSGNNPHPSAGLDVDFNNKGVLIPRLTTNQRDNILNPAVGLQIYNLDSDCLEMFFNQGGWLKVRCGCTSFPDATFTSSSNLFVNSNVQFSAVENNAANTYIWSFQSGNPSSGNAALSESQWNTSGSYQVTLNVIDEVGCSSSSTQTIEIENCSPTIYSFSTCGQTGRFGPTQTQCNATYDNTPLENAVQVNSGIQEWTVPLSGSYKITTAGARGGNSNDNSGGAGALIIGEFDLVAGQNVKVLVGQAGLSGFNASGPSSAGGGGGGSYVLVDDALVIAAGGGGGANQSSRGTAPGGSGLTTTFGGNSNVIGSNGDAAPGPGGGSRASGGDDGYGGGGGTAAGGGGFIGNGGVTSPVGSGFGLSLVNGGNGGVANNFDADGGFGAGGGGHIATGAYGGGGGGYSGGGGGGWTGNTTPGSAGSGGGGGSLNTGNNQINTSGSNSGAGYVTIEFICD